MMRFGESMAAPSRDFYGANDARITATVAGTTDKMKTLTKVYEPHVYEGAGHGFMRPAALPRRTRPPTQKAAEQLWLLVIIAS